MPLSSQARAKFGDFELNLKTRELSSNGHSVLLQDQPFRILVLLLERGSEGASRQEIKSNLWPDDTTVNFEQSINAAVKNLRRSLDDSSDNPKYIETLPRLGYRLLVTTQWMESLRRGDAAESKNATEGEAPPTSLEPHSRDGDRSGSKRGPKNGSKTAVVSGSANGWKVAILVLAIILPIAISGWLYSRSPRLKSLTDKDTVVLADFTNSTGDVVFDETLKQGLAIQLEQSPFLSLVPEGKLNQTLKLMGRAAGSALTPEVAREVCQRTGSAAVISGSIAALGSQYVIGLKAVNCNSGDVLAQTQVQAKHKEEVPGLLGTATTTLRRKLGESLSSVQKYSTPMAEATTPSLEALRAYSVGQKENAENGDMAALPFYQRAVGLDPNFAMAYRGMAAIYSNQNEPERAAENTRKAYELRAKTSERERFAIEAQYYMIGTGELEKAAQTYELWQQTFPRDRDAYRDSAVIAGSLGRLDKVLEKSLVTLRMDPGDVVNYVDLGLAYVFLNRFAEAEAAYNQADADPQGNNYLIEPRYVLAFCKDDKAEMARMVAAAEGKPGIEDRLLEESASTEASYGKLRNARELTQRAINLAEQDDAREAAGMYQAIAALREVEMGHSEQGRAHAKAAVRFGPNREAQTMAALALARAGDTATAEKLADELDKRFPLDTLVQRYRLPTIRAAIALQHHDPNRAIELLKSTSAIELGDTGNLLPVYIRGQAYLSLHDGKAAAAEFQKFIEYRGMVANFELAASARLGLARAYALEAVSDSAARDRGRAAYKDFLNLWKDADPDLPIYKQAKAEYGKLS